MKIFSVLILALQASSCAVTALSSVSFGGVNLQLQSSDANGMDDLRDENILLEVLTQTVKYLDHSFYQNFQSSEYEFSHVALSVDSYDIDSNKDRNLASFTFSGSAYFITDLTPPEEDVIGILAHSFMGSNSQVFANTLMEAKNPFLKRLSYATVKVNGFDFPPSVMVDPDDSSPADSLDIQQIAVIAGVSSMAVLLILLCYCFCCVTSDDDDSNDKDHPVPTQKRTIDTSDTSDEVEEQTGDIEAVISPAPSSPQSIASQDSSIFTYNPTSKISFDASTLSTNTTETNTLDLRSWQQRDTINSSRFAPFGHDISAIEMLNENKKDLSLIEEGDETATPVKSNGEYLSKDLLSRRERMERSSKSRSRGDVSYQSERSDAANSDVIADLRNLSQQINHYRYR